MDSPTPQDEAAIRAALFDRLLADRLESRPQPGAVYRELFPEHQALVDRELAALEGGSALECIADSVSGTIGHYRLLQELGRGGQGVVYLAEDAHLHRRVALKVLSARGPQAAHLLRRFQREAEVASRLDHAGICAVYEAGVADGVLFIAMRYVEGETLAAQIEAARGRDRPTPWRELCATLELFEKCALALHHAHEAGVIHRDVKPTNIMIDRRGDPVILDFGLAREEDDPALTRTGDFVGTPAYASPELLSGARRDLDLRTDVYSLGVSLFEAATGRRPFEAPTPAGLFQAVLTQEVPDPRGLDRGITSDLKVVLETALAKDIRRRYGSALDLAIDLRAVRDREPIRARPDSGARRLGRWARRAPAQAALVILLALGLPALAGLGGYLLAHHDELVVGRGVLFRGRVDRAIDRGFQALVPGSAEAEHAFREALALDPANVEAAAGLTLHLLRVHQRDARPSLDEARRVLDRQEELIGREPDLLRLRLLCAEAAGDAREAEALSREIGDQRSALGYVLESAPYWPLVVANPSNMRAAKEMHRLATLACDFATTPRIYHYSLRGVAASVLGDRDETASVADTVLTRWKGDRDASLAAAGILSGPPDAELARRLIEEQVLPRDPDLSAAWMVLGLRWWGEDYAQVERCLERALELGGPNRWALCRLGHARIQLGRPEESLQAFDQALGLGEVVPEDLVGRGIARLRLGDFKGAEEDFRRSVGLWEGYYGGEYELAPLLEQTGPVEEALRFYRRCVVVDDRSVTCWIRLAQALDRAGRFAEARAAWEESTWHLPEEPLLWNGLAWASIDPTHAPADWSPKLAVSHAERAVALSGGEEPGIMNTLGVALYRNGEDARALETLRRSAALQAERDPPGSVFDQAFIAAAAARLGRLEEAAQALDSARRLLALGPDGASMRASMAEAEAAVAAAQVAGTPP